MNLPPGVRGLGEPAYAAIRSELETELLRLREELGVI
jgi:hypothetical protein